MQIEFTGTGDSATLPVGGCHCLACQTARQNPAFRRRESGLIITSDLLNIQIDAGRTDLISQHENRPFSHILLTHFHMDHVLGLFPLRWQNFDSIPVLHPPDPAGAGDLFKHPGCLGFQSVEPFQPISFKNLTITPLPLNHSKLCFGYLIETDQSTIAYLTDTRGLPDDTMAFLTRRTLDLLILDCSFVAPKGKVNGHNSYPEAEAIAKALQPKLVRLTHIGHDLQTDQLTNPDKYALTFAADGEKVQFG